MDLCKASSSSDLFAFRIRSVRINNASGRSNLYQISPSPPAVGPPARSMKTIRVVRAEIVSAVVPYAVEMRLRCKFGQGAIVLKA